MQITPVQWNRSSQRFQSIALLDSNRLTYPFSNLILICFYWVAYKCLASQMIFGPVLISLWFSHKIFDIGSFNICLNVMILLLKFFYFNIRYWGGRETENTAWLLHLRTWVLLLLLVHCTVLWLNTPHIVASQCELGFYLSYLRF